MSDRYALRYTRDLYVWRTGATVEEIRPSWSDHLVHIWDRETQTCVWQNGRSIRYGTTGLEGLVSETVSDGVLTLAFADGRTSSYLVL